MRTAVTPTPRPLVCQSSHQQVVDRMARQRLPRMDAAGAAVGEGPRGSVQHSLTRPARPAPVLPGAQGARASSSCMHPLARPLTRCRFSLSRCAHTHTHHSAAGGAPSAERRPAAGGSDSLWRPRQPQPAAMPVHGRRRARALHLHRALQLLVRAVLAACTGCAGLAARRTRRRASRCGRRRRACMPCVARAHGLQLRHARARHGACAVWGPPPPPHACPVPCCV
jgi:hypothetical protein